MMKFFSTFTGIGGLDIGLKGIAKNVGFSEIKESSIKIYSKHYPDHKNYGDLTKINYKELPDFDILTGGFPCQAFSMAGAREGFKNRKGQLIFYIYDLLTAKKPQFVVLENVKGLLSHDDGKTYNNVMQLLSLAGYYVRVLLLNALNYGTAQNRERLIFLCSKDDFIAKKPEIINQNVVFRDVRQSLEQKDYKFIKYSERNERKINQLEKFNFELIGGYDRVGTLTTQYGCGEKLVYWNGLFRYLTPVECERLQGFDDNWTEGVSDANRYFALGNAVNCNMSNYIFKNYLKGVWW